jgi:hypothetical protein
MQYNTSTSDMANVGRTKIEQMFTEGRAEASEAVGLLQQSVPTDMVVPGKGITFMPNGAGVQALFQGVEQRHTFHHHALTQVVGRGRVRLPWRFVDDLLREDRRIREHNAQAKIEDDKEREWGREALARLLNDVYREVPNRFLVRAVGNEVRGFLSDRYKRIDSAPVIEAFMEEAHNIGAVPVQAKFTPTKFWLKAMIPHVFEPVKDEVMGVGVTFHNSDYGDGAYWIKFFMMRLICRNGMMGEDIMRRVHLGSRLGDEVAFSDETHQLDTKTVVSATRDIVKDVLGPEQVEHRMKLISAAAETEVDATARIEAMRKASRLTKDESKRLREIYSSAEVEMLPPGNTAWRLSNALSLFAQETDPARGLELESMAGDVVTPDKEEN